MLALFWVVFLSSHQNYYDSTIHKEIDEKLTDLISSLTIYVAGKI